MWGVPVDHEMFKELNSAQWLWYYHNLMEDRKDKFEHDRNMIEYNASFIEPEAVRKIRESRDQAVEIPEDQFLAGIQKIFGRSLDTGARPKETEMHKVDLNKVLNDFQQLKNASVKPQGFNYKDWTKINLGK
jgi:hypothetical protein